MDHFSIAFLMLMCGMKATHAMDCTKDDEYDFIIVGSGASGSVIANRLTDVEDWKVLIIEAGGEPLHVSKIPLITFKALGTEMDWKYKSVPQIHCCQSFINESVPQSRGKCLGGTTSINFMTYTRGSPFDYNLWKDLGNSGWGFDDLKPYFMKLEDYNVPMSREDVQYHHKGGPMTVEIPPFKSVLANAFAELGSEMGYSMVDYNGKDQIGFMYPPVTTRNGERCGTYRAYLQPAMERKNLKVLTKSLVTKLIFDDNDKTKVVGVEYESEKGFRCIVHAKKEVIVSGGTYNSPQLLMLSGIGPKQHLEKFDITVMKDMPGVGENLQDHVTIGGMMFTINQNVGMNSVKCETPEIEQLWEITKTGPMTVPVSFEGVAYLNSGVHKDDPAWPDLEMFFNTDNSVRIYKPILKNFANEMIPPDEVDGFTFHPILLRPKSRGNVQLFSRDPHDHPRIDPKYLSHEDDIKVMEYAIDFIIKCGKSKALTQYGAQLVKNGIFGPCLMEVMGGMPAYARCFAKMFSSTAYHPTSTCKMGPSSDPMAVVDNNLKIHGLTGVRVADASIMPNVVAAHTQVACIVIGEKISDIIKSTYGK